MNVEKTDYIVFDVETQRTFDEVKGPNPQAQLGVSYVGVYSYRQEKFFGFFEHELPTLEKILLREQPTLIGFNSLHFDVPVLQPYFPTLDLLQLAHIDILKEVEKALGHRLKLDTIANATLYEGKSATGLDAIRWYRAGNLTALAAYCIDDVKVTRDVYDYGLRHGHLLYSTGGERKPIPISWGLPPLVADQLHEAFKRHEQLEIEYFEIIPQQERKIVTTIVDVLGIDHGRIDAFCHRTNTKRRFDIANIWQLRELGKTFAHQDRLF